MFVATGGASCTGALHLKVVRNVENFIRHFFYILIVKPLSVLITLIPKNIHLTVHNKKIQQNL